MQVKKCFKPEFLSRLSEIVVFEPLSRHHLKEIVNIQLKSALAKIVGKGISVVINDAVLDVILSESHDPVSIFLFKVIIPSILSFQIANSNPLSLCY